MSDWASIDALIASCKPKSPPVAKTYSNPYVFPDREFNRHCKVCDSDFITNNCMRVVCDTCIEGWRNIFLTRRLPGKDYNNG